MGSSSRVIGLASTDLLRHVALAAGYVYAAGALYTAAGARRAAALKLDRSDLSGVYDVANSSAGSPESYAILPDGTSVFLVVDNTVAANGLLILIRLNTSDMTLDTARSYAAGGGVNYIHPAAACQDASNIYICGNDDTLAVYHGIVAKTSKTAYTATPMVFSAVNTYCTAIAQDNDFLYVAGYLSGNNLGFIAKINKSDMTLADFTSYGGEAGQVTEFHGVAVYGNYVYAVGWTNTEGAGGYDALIIRYNKSNLSIDSRKILGGAGNDYFDGVWVDPDDGQVYAVGRTGADILITKWANNLSTVTQVSYSGGATSDIAWGITGDADGLVIVGQSDSEGAGNADGFILLQDKDLTTGTTTPAGFTCATTTLTLANSALQIDSVSYSLSSFTLTASAVTPTLADSGATLSAPYVIGTVPAPGGAPSPPYLIYPIDPIIRVTGIIHRYNRAEQVYSMEINLGDLTTDFGIPDWFERPQTAITAKVDTSATRGDVDKMIKRQVEEDRRLAEQGAEAYRRKYPGPQPFGPLGPPTPDREEFRGPPEPQRKPWWDFWIGITNVREPATKLWRTITPWKEQQGETVSSWLKGLLGGKR